VLGQKAITVDQLTDYFTVIMSGMAVMSKVGVTQRRLFNTIELAVTDSSVSELNHTVL
jgi:hypothetical protein